MSADVLRRLHVFAFGSHAGILEEVSGDGRPPTYRFSYDGNATTPVSVLLPLSKKVFVTERLPAIFSQNLPEGIRLARLQEAGRVARVDDAFGLLGITGQSCLGHLQFSVSENPPSESLPAVSVTDSRDRVLRLIEESLLQGISGVQPKLLGEMPRTLVAQNVIVKTSGDDYPDLALNEWLTLRAAASCGIVVAGSRLSEDGQSLLVSRFDRSSDGSMLAVEEAASLIGLSATEKYLGSYENIAEAIERNTFSPEADIERFFRQLVFCCAVRNGDAHMKNFALLSDGSACALSPAYDLVTTGAYVGPGEYENPALCLSWGNFSKRWWSPAELLSFAENELSIPSKKAGQIMSDVVDGLASAAGTLSSSGMEGAMRRCWEDGLRQLAVAPPRRGRSP